MTSQNQDALKDFFKVFTESIVKTLSENLDNDVCKRIKVDFNSSSRVQDKEALKENNAIYKLDYATGTRQGNIAILVPEELLANIADILTGGNGKDVYKGSLSEIETNSTIKILDKIFKDIEKDFQHAYGQNFIFSANPSLFLKEMEEYSIDTEGVISDFLINLTLSLNEDSSFQINLLLNENSLNNLMGDLGFSKSNSSSRKTEPSSLDLNCLSDVKINITAELGRTQVPIKYALELIKGSLVELDTQNNADIKVFANGVEFAYAQVVAIDENFGLKITKIISPEERLGCI